MHLSTRRRARRGILMTAVLGAVSILALSGLALAHGGHGDHPQKGPDTGTIASFDSTAKVLTIELTEGGEVSGLVTRRTRIKCEDEHSAPPPPPPATRPGSEPGENRGRGPEAGDDSRGPGSGHGPESDDDGHPGNSGPGSGPSRHDDNGTGANCTPADLIVGAVVHQAKLDLKGGKALFRSVELAE